MGRDAKEAPPCNIITATILTRRSRTKQRAFPVLGDLPPIRPVQTTKAKQKTPTITCGRSYNAQVFFPLTPYFSPMQRPPPQIIIGRVCNAQVFFSWLFLRPGRSFPVLSRIKPQAPLLGGAHPSISFSRVRPSAIFVRW